MVGIGTGTTISQLLPLLQGGRIMVRYLGHHWQARSTASPRTAADLSSTKHHAWFAIFMRR